MLFTTDLFDPKYLYYIRLNHDCFPIARLCLITDVSRPLLNTHVKHMSIYVVCSLVSSAWGTIIMIEMNKLEVSNTLPHHIRWTWS